VQCADEVVVVRKREPMKVGNDEEGKTPVTGCQVILAVMSQKRIADAKDGRDLKGCWRAVGLKMKALKEG